MKFFSIFLLLILNFFVITYASRAENITADDKDIYSDDYKAAELVQNSLKKNNRKAVADLIDYPLVRELPLSAIKNSQEFLENWDDYFDAANIKIILDSKAGQIGWRGVQLANGGIWFNNGHIRSINLKTNKYKNKLLSAKKLESSTLYESAKGYDKIEFQCETKTLHIRTQYHGNDLRYFAWKKGDALSTKPQLELGSGIYDAQGSGGNHDLIFHNRDYTYKLEIVLLCGEDCNNYLTVLKNNKTISRQACN